jgi:hypothetical protein
MVDYDRRYLTETGVVESFDGGFHYDIEMRTVSDEMSVIMAGPYTWAVPSGPMVKHFVADHTTDTVMGYGDGICVYAVGRTLRLFKITELVTHINFLGVFGIGAIADDRFVILVGGAPAVRDANIVTTSRMPPPCEDLDLPAELTHIIGSFMGDSMGLHDKIAYVDNFEYVAQLHVATDVDVNGKKWHHGDGVWVSGNAHVTRARSCKNTTIVSEITSNGNTREWLTHYVIDFSKQVGRDDDSARGGDDCHVLAQRYGHTVEISDGCLLADNKQCAYLGPMEFGDPYDVIPSYTIVPCEGGDIEILW